MAKFNITILLIVAIAFMGFKIADPADNCGDLSLSYKTEKGKDGTITVNVSIGYDDDNDDQGNDDRDGGSSNYVSEGVTFYYVFYDEDGNLLSTQYDRNEVVLLQAGTYYVTVVGEGGCKMTKTITIN